MRLWLWTGAVFLAAFLPLAATIDDPGEIWDEPVYLEAVDKACGWFGDLVSPTAWQSDAPPFSRKSLHEHWVYGRFGIVFHPPGGGYPAMLTRAIVGGWTAPRTSARLATALQLAAAAALVFHFLARRVGRAAGLFAAAALVTMPRVFAEGHLFATDVPAMLWWSVSAVLFWKTQEEGNWRTRIGFALALGYAFLVKPTAVMVLLPLAAWVCGRGVTTLLASSKREYWLQRAGRGLALCGAIAAPLVMAGIVILSLAGAMQGETERKIIEYKNAELAGRSDLSLQEKEQEIRKDMARWLAFIDLQNPGVEEPAGGAGLLLFPALLWLLRAAWIRSGRAPAWLRYGGNLMELALATLAWSPAFVFLLGPCWWSDTLVRLAHYFSLNFQRQGALPDIEILYLGRKYVYTLPWHNGWVLLAMTLPVGTLLLAIVGSGLAVWGARVSPEQETSELVAGRLHRSVGRFLLVNALALPVLRMLGVPAHDGVRLMMPTMFFIAALAGIGFAWLLARIAALRGRESAGLALAGGLLFLAPGMYGIGWSHPYELSYYNVFVGGLPGAHRQGFEVTYWYDAVNRPALERILEALPAGSTLVHHQHVDVFSDWEQEVLGPKVRTTVMAPANQTYFGLLTHGSKSNPTTRLMWGMTPHSVPATLKGVRLYTVYAPETLARTTALVLLVRAGNDRPSPEGPEMIPARYSQEVLRLARERGETLRQAAALVSRAAQSQEKPAEIVEMLAGASPEVRQALEILLGPRLENFGYFRHTMGRFLADYPRSVEDAAAILTARPDTVERLITSGYYPPDEELAPFLDKAVRSPGAAARPAENLSLEFLSRAE